MSTAVGEMARDNSLKLEDFQAVLFTFCDTFGQPRGKFAVGKGIHNCSNSGIELTDMTCFPGFNSKVPPTSDQVIKKREAACLRLLPDLSTLQPLGWLCNDHRKVGHVLCDLFDAAGNLDMCSSRGVVLKQLQNLTQKGFQIMSAFEVEYHVYHKGTLQPYGGESKDLASIVKLDTDLTFYYQHMMGLLEAGIPVETQMLESVPGQIEYSMRPLFGISAADSVHRLRYVTKALCDRQGLEPSFMTRPKLEKTNSGFHLNHSLWTLSGKNVFYDPQREDKCSSVLWHWLAGLVEHGPALVALMCPTVNCFRRLHNHFTPSDNNWNFNDRNARLRVKTKGTNVHIEERTPSAASNPYLSLAGLIAAGLDGLDKKLEAPPPRIYRPKASGSESCLAQNPLPKSLQEALEALEQDQVLGAALGEEFVHEYVGLCREFQPLNSGDVEPEQKLQTERDLYLHSL